jgi:hypothetical protein
VLVSQESVPVELELAFDPQQEGAAEDPEAHLLFRVGIR